MADSLHQLHGAWFRWQSTLRTYHVQDEPHTWQELSTRLPFNPTDHEVKPYPPLLVDKDAYELHSYLQDGQNRLRFSFFRVLVQRTYRPEVSSELLHILRPDNARPWTELDRLGSPIYSLLRDPLSGLSESTDGDEYRRWKWSLAVPNGKTARAFTRYAIDANQMCHLVAEEKIEGIYRYRRVRAIDDEPA